MHTDASLVHDMLKPASDGDVKDITRAFLISPGFDELSKRSLLARILKAYPFVEGMIVKSGDQKTEEDGPDTSATYIVSWESLNKTKNEYEELLNKKIPENTKDIAIARSYGDMRENHEFKAAKEMQSVLMRRKAEIESMLARAQGTDFKGSKTTAVGLGTIVSLRQVESGKEMSYTILGAWDSVPEKGVISYLTVLAQTLMGKKVGDVIELPLENGKNQVKVEKIVAYNP
jgi:transcription elongation GreA/GreB family factor